MPSSPLIDTIDTQSRVINDLSLISEAHSLAGAAPNFQALPINVREVILNLDIPSFLETFRMPVPGYPLVSVSLTGSIYAANRHQPLPVTLNPFVNRASVRIPLEGRNRRIHVDAANLAYSAYHNVDLSTGLFIVHSANEDPMDLHYDNLDLHDCECEELIDLEEAQIKLRDHEYGKYAQDTLGPVVLQQAADLRANGSSWGTIRSTLKIKTPQHVLAAAVIDHEGGVDPLPEGKIARKPK